MKKEEYLAELKLNLTNNDFGPVEEAIAYFDEMLQDRMDEGGMSEEAATASMDSPDKVARMMIDAREHQDQQLRSGQPTQASSENEASQPVSEEGAGQARQATPEAQAHQMPGIKTITLDPLAVRMIIIRDRNQRVVVKSGREDQIVLSHPENERVRYQFSLENGVLSLVREPLEFSIQSLSFFFGFRDLGQVELTVPRELAASLDLQTRNASLSLSDFDCWGEIKAQTSNDNLVIKQVTAKAFDLKTSNARLEAQHVATKGNLQLRTSNARITCADANANQASLQTSNARVEATRMNVTDALTVQTSNGKIVFDSLKAAAYSFKTSNSKVEGVLKGSMADYAIQSGTSNGKNSLPSSQPGQTPLSVYTSNARIDVGFSQR